MTFEQVRACLLSQPRAIKDRPFALDVSVDKIAGKMFAYSSPNDMPPCITIKLGPLLGQILRSTCEAVQLGYHMDKEHWNTAALDGSTSDEKWLFWIDESCTVVLSKLPQRIRKQIVKLCTHGA